MSGASRQAAATNAGALVVAGISARVLAWLAFVVIARALGPGDVAVIAVGLAVGALVFEAGEGGLDPVVVRLLSRGPHRESMRLGAALGAKALLGTVGLLVGVAVSAMLVDSPERLRTVAWLLLGVWCGGFGRTLAMLFQARERFVYRGIMESARAATLAIGAYLVTRGPPSLEAVGQVYFAAEVMQAVVSFSIYRARFGGGSVRIRWRAVRAVLGETVRPALAAALAMFYLLADHLILWHFAAPEELGAYEAVQRIVLALAIVPAALAHSVFPSLAARDATRGRDLYRASLQVLVTLGWPLAFGGFVLGADLVAWVYGSAFDAYARAFAGLAFLSSGAIFLAYLPSSALVALGRTGPLLRITAGLAVFNVVANLIVVPLEGATGAAAVMLATQGMGLVAYAREVRRELGLHGDLAPRLAPLPVVVAASCSAIVATVIPGPLPLRIASGAAVHVAVLAVAGALPMKELAVLRQPPSQESGSPA